MSEGEGDLQHFLSLALRMEESDDEDDDKDEMSVLPSAVSPVMLLLLTGKLVLALRPLIKTAASS